MTDPVLRAGLRNDYGYVVTARLLDGRQCADHSVRNAVWRVLQMRPIDGCAHELARFIKHHGRTELAQREALV